MPDHSLDHYKNTVFPVVKVVGRSQPCPGDWKFWGVIFGWNWKLWD